MDTSDTSHRNIDDTKNAIEYLKDLRTQDVLFQDQIRRLSKLAESGQLSSPFLAFLLEKKVLTDAGVKKIQQIGIGEDGTLKITYVPPIVHRVIKTGRALVKRVIQH